MQLIDPTERAERVLDLIVSAYLGPNHTPHELRQFASEGCRAKLKRFGDA
ncbi:hypothetical protein [Novosphingobium sp. SG707]|nr:hypothetical protein [Novosphingobium sp. SG707]NKJ00974.1 hypothetical protein [Novosphingobium sp. SG707]